MGNTELDGADLSEAQLQGAWLYKASLTGTKLYRARISEDTDLTESNWWKADFFGEDGTSVDTALIQRLIKKYGMPDIADEPHDSVRSILKIVEE